MNGAFIFKLTDAIAGAIFKPMVISVGISHEAFMGYEPSKEFDSL